MSTTESELMERIGRAAERSLGKVFRGVRNRRGPTVEVNRFELKSTAGYRLIAWMHRLAHAQGPAPAVVLCPGIDDGANVFVNGTAPISADEVARLGCIAIRFDPAGRGDSWGDEDFGGAEHQDDVATVVRHLKTLPQVDPKRIGIVTISLGVAMGVGAVVHAGADVAWLIDWEGPCDREIITAGGTIMAPANGHSIDDEVYWPPREAVRWVGRLSCGYLRLQTYRDHAQPGELRHARRMIRAAGDGDLPWFQINDHPRGEVPDRPTWLRSGMLASNRALLRKIRLLAASN
jgi:pimeloyl-ACP methyl ester carboxylesterase